jgi:hypothetical protein
MNRIRLGVVAVLAMGAVACDQTTEVPHADATQPLAVQGAVQAVLEQQTPAADGAVTFVVRVRGNGVTLSSFQGEVTFAPGSLELVAMTTPPSEGGAMRFINPDDFASGRIRFAGLTPTAFSAADVTAGVEAFRFTARALRPLPDVNVVAALDVAGRNSGDVVPAARLYSSSGGSNLTRLQ